MSHTASISAVSVSHDSTLALTASWDRTARVWDLATGACVRVLRGHRHPVIDAKFSRDARTAITGALDGRVRLWTVETGKHFKIIKVAQDELLISLSLSPDASCFVASVGLDHSLWDARTGARVRVFEPCPYWITSFIFSPDARFIIAGSYKEDPCVWNVATGRIVERLPPESHDPRETRLVFPEYECWDVFNVRAIRVDTGAVVVPHIPIWGDRAHGETTRAAVTRNGKYLVKGCDRGGVYVSRVHAAFERAVVAVLSCPRWRAFFDADGDHALASVIFALAERNIRAPTLMGDDEWSDDDEYSV